MAPLDQRRDWFEQDFFPEDDTDRVGATNERDGETRWAREMRLRHALIDGNENPENKSHESPCVVWDETASPAAEALLPLMCDWLTARYPERYIRDEEHGGVFLPDLDGWATGPLGKIKGVEALKTCAKLVQEDLCFVKEETLEEAWDAVDESFGSFDEDEDENETHTRHAFRAGVVCFSFDPEKRRGKTLAGLHRPVPGYEARMRRAVSRVFSGLSTEKPLWRANWALQNNAEIVSTALEWHPSNVKMGGVAERSRFANEIAKSKSQREGVDDVVDDVDTPADSTFADTKHVGYMDPLSSLPADPEAAGRAMRLRVEYETVTRLPGARDVSRWILFTVRTHMDALERLDDETCAALLKGITSSDADELEYKSLGNEETRGAVVAYLEGRRRNGVVRGTNSSNNAVAGTTSKPPTVRGCPMASADTATKAKENANAGAREPTAEATTPPPRKKMAKTRKNEKKTRDESLQSPIARRLTSEPLFFESGRGSVASDMGIDPWPSSAWGVAKASAPPASWYAAEPNARRESETVFRRGWHFCGRADQAPRGAPGSYFTATVGGSAGASIVVVRGTDDKLRAFWNVCRHRAMEVAPDPNSSVPPTESNANTGNASFGLFAGRFKKRLKNGAEEKKSARRTTGGGTTGSFGVTGKDSPRDGDASFETIACDRGVLRDECLTCPYHGWTYDLTGALVKVPRLAGTEAFETNENGLREIAVSVWGPFVWCAFLDDSSSNRGDENDVDVTDTTSPVTDTTSPGIVPPVAEWLGAGGAFLARCGSVPSGDREPLRFVTKRAYRVNCNWKVFVDNYLDGGYHVPVAHPALASGIDMKTYETRVEGNTVTQIVFPATEKKKETEETMNRRMTGVDHTSATYAYVYPNFMVNRYGPWMDTNLVTPTSATTCVVTFEYFLEPAFLNDAAFVRDSLAASHAVQMEDIELCEKVQRGMRSPGYAPGRYVGLEKGMYHFHRKVWEDLTDDAE